MENVDYVARIDCLRATGARVKFLSVEPLLGREKGRAVTTVNGMVRLAE